MTKNEYLIIGGAIVALAAVVVYYEVSTSKPAGIVPNPAQENCITLSRDEIVNSWLDPGWNKPGDPNYIPAIIFEPIAGDAISVVAYPVDKDCNPIPEKKLNMKITNPTGSKCSFPDGLLLGRTRYEFVPEDTDAFGDLTYFNFLRLVSQIDPTDPTKLGFQVKFVKSESGVERALDRADTKPCPPFCPVQ